MSFRLPLGSRSMLHPPYATQTNKTLNKQTKRYRQNKQTNKEIEACKQKKRHINSYVTNVGLDCVHRSIGLNYGRNMCQQAKLLKVGLRVSCMWTGANPHENLF